MDVDRMLLDLPSVKRVTVRPVKARAMQFKYAENPDVTSRLAERIVACLDVKVSTSYDPQCGRGYHLECGNYVSKLLCEGDWIVVDSFGKADVVKDKDFNVYYEPALD